VNLWLNADSETDVLGRHGFSGKWGGGKIGEPLCTTLNQNTSLEGAAQPASQGKAHTREKEVSAGKIAAAG
jgi:hypothetical protein